MVFLLTCSPAFQTNYFQPPFSWNLPLPSLQADDPALTFQEELSIPAGACELSSCLHPHTSDAGLPPGPLMQLLSMSPPRSPHTACSPTSSPRSSHSTCSMYTCCRQLGLCGAVGFTLSKVPLTHPKDMAQTPWHSWVPEPRELAGSSALGPPETLFLLYFSSFQIVIVRFSLNTIFLVSLKAPRGQAQLLLLIRLPLTLRKCSIVFTKWKKRKKRIKVYKAHIWKLICGSGSFAKIPSLNKC